MNTQNQFGYTEDESGIWEPTEDLLDGTAVERPFVFISLRRSPDELEGVLRRYVESGAGGVIPYLPADADGEFTDDREVIASRRRLRRTASACEKSGAARRAHARQVSSAHVDRR